MSRLRTAALATTGVLALAAGAGTVGVASSLTPPAPQAGTTVTSVEVPAGITRAACAPAPVLADDYQGYDADLNPIDVETSAEGVVFSLPRDVGPAETSVLHDGTATDLSGDAARAAALTPTGGAPMLTANPVDGVAPLLAGGGAWRVDAGDLRGLVALPCGVARTDQWLIGGSTVLGSSATLTVTNPGDTPATVDVEGWGQTGRLELPMLAGLTVAPQSSEAFLLEASDSTIERLALHVQAAGASVYATLQTSHLDGYTPLGIDTVAPGASPATELVIPAVSLGEAFQDPATEVDGDRGPLVRLTNPGDSAATVALTLLTPDGPVPVPGADSVVVDAGAVFDVSLAGLPAGAHSVAVTSDVPVLAAAQSVRTSSVPGGLERAWSPAVPRSSSFGLTHLASVADSTVVVANPGDADVTAQVTPYTADGAAGEPVSVTVPAQSTAAVPDLGEADGALLAADGDVAAATVLTNNAPDGQLVAILPGLGDDAVAQTVDVDLRER